MNLLGKKINKFEYLSYNDIKTISSHSQVSVAFLIKAFL